MITQEVTYPNAPGWKSEEPETSKAAAVAETSRAAILRTLVVSAYEAHGPMTADEAAGVLGESVLSVRPRVAELHRQAPPVLEDSGERRRNASGKNAAVWRLVRRQEQRDLGLC